MTRWMETFKWDPDHMRQVSALALMVFDDLRPLHGLDDHARFLLQAAAIAHDVGFLYDEENHHKVSFDLIRRADFPGLSEMDQMMIALIARYHRKSHPKKKHKFFDALEEKDKERVRKLAAMLRIADGLDRTHTNFVSKVKCQFTESSLIFLLDPYEEKSPEVQAALKKSALLTEVFNRRVLFCSIFHLKYDPALADIDLSSGRIKKPTRK